MNTAEYHKTLLEYCKKVDEKDDRKTLHWLVLLFKDNDNSLLEAALKQSFDISAKDDIGWTPLHYACYWDKKNKARILLSYKANPNDRDVFGNTPIDLARNKQNSEMLLILTGT